jgi:hypothetical protein
MHFGSNAKRVRQMCDAHGAGNAALEVPTGAHKGQAQISQFIALNWRLPESLWSCQ